MTENGMDTWQRKRMSSEGLISSALYVGIICTRKRNIWILIEDIKIIFAFARFAELDVEGLIFIE